MKRIFPLFICILAIMVLSHCSFSKSRYLDSQKSGLKEKPDNFESLALKLFTNSKNIENSTLLEILYPFDEAVFPPEIAAPTISWIDKTGISKNWLIIIEFRNMRKPIYVETNMQHWTPEKSLWEIIKANSIKDQAVITVIGFESMHSYGIAAKNSVRITTSEDPVDASVFYRQVQLPFTVGKKNFKKVKWRLGDISSYEEPAVVMKNLPVCASCHLFSKDGTVMSMEMNYKNDSGAQLIASVKENIELSEANFISWNDFPKPELLPNTRGTFAKISPTGKYVVSTVNEISYFALTNDPAFCQLFFPTYGILAWYSVDKNHFERLPGADNYDVIQTDPSWSWDEKYIAFSRAKTRNEYHEDIGNIKTHIEDKNIHELNKKFPIRFNIYRIPFNKGKGGPPEPVKGAGNNNMSNYFPRYSPNGKWIVFTRSKTGIMLQPDSELFIVPAEGGEARRMRCNRKVLNSWHSWSPNGNWLLFSSKVNTMFTEIFLTHVDENGNDSPPVCLSRFSDGQFAANVPEFVNMNPNSIKKITLRTQK